MASTSRRGGGSGSGGGGKRGGSQRSGSPAGTEATATSDQRRKKTQMIDEITAEFQNLGIAVGDPHLEPQQAPGNVGQVMKVVTNVYGVKMNQIPVFRYDITLSAVFGGRREGKRLEFTKRSKEDSVVTDRKGMCRLVFLAFLEKHQDVFGDNPYAYYYDLQCILYSLKELDLGQKKEHVFELNANDCQTVQELQRFVTVEMLIRKVRDGFQLTLGDLSHLTNDTTQQNHSLQQFIELATSQCPLFNPREHLILGGGTSFLLAPDNYGFTEQDSPLLSDSKYLAIGAHKSVRYVEGPQGRNNKHTGLIVETKKTPFHVPNQTLMQKAAVIIGGNAIGEYGEMHPRDVSRIHNQFKTLHISVQYGRNQNRDIRITGVKANTARNTNLDVNGETVTVEQYYLQKYDLRLRFPEAPLATALERGRTNFYPLEVCYMKDHQRANLQQLNSREVANMIRSCAVPPNILKYQTEKNVEALQLHNSEYLQSAGISITSKPLTVGARLLPNPQIQYRNTSVNTNEDGKWQLNDNFLVPASCVRWAMYMIPGGRSEVDRRGRFTEEQMRQFAQIFVQACRACGMTIENPADMRQIDSLPEAVEHCINVCKQEGCTFVFFITADSVTNLHNVIKMYEQKYEIVTQDLKMNNAFEIVTRGKQETVRNIVCKTNEKLGGLNYSITVRDQQIREMIMANTLFIGLGISHPGAMGNYERARGKTPDVPSVIGYAANMKKDPFDFVGDYVYDEPRRDEKFSTVSTIVKNCVERYRNHRNKNPERLIIYRNGTSEGQFGMSLQFEVPLIKYALEKELNIPDCKVTILVSQKAHNIRLFKSDMPQNTEITLPNGRVKKINVNIKPGTVVDTQLTHPMQSEFYLNSHLAIQGTARTPRYTVLLDESKFSLDTIENFTYALSYAHQIINSPTSLPSPAYIALLYAKRGRAVHTESRRMGTEDEKNEDGTLDFQAISNRLAYCTTTLADQRVNA